MPTMNLENLSGLNAGLAGKLIDAEIATAVADFDQRGEQDCEERSVTIKIKLWYDPKEDEKRAVVTVASKIPAKTTAEVKGRTKRDGQKVRFLWEDIKEIEDDENDDEREARESVARASRRKPAAEASDSEHGDGQEREAS